MQFVIKKKPSKHKFYIWHRIPPELLKVEKYMLYDMS